MSKQGASSSSDQATRNAEYRALSGDSAKATADGQQHSLSKQELYEIKSQIEQTILTLREELTKITRERNQELAVQDGVLASAFGAQAKALEKLSKKIDSDPSVKSTVREVQHELRDAFNILCEDLEQRASRGMREEETRAALELRDAIQAADRADTNSYDWAERKAMMEDHKTACAQRLQAREKYYAQVLKMREQAARQGLSILEAKHAKRMDMLTAEVTKREHDTAALIDERSTLERRVQALQGQIDEYREHSAQSQDMRKQEIDRLREELAVVQGEVREGNRKVAELEEIEKENTDLERKIASQKKEYTDIEAEANKLDASYRKAQQRNEELHRLIADLRNKQRICDDIQQQQAYKEQQPDAKWDDTHHRPPSRSNEGKPRGSRVYFDGLNPLAGEQAGGKGIQSAGGTARRPRSATGRPDSTARKGKGLGRPQSAKVL